jgi:hypothetical protein
MGNCAYTTSSAFTGLAKPVTSDWATWSSAITSKFGLANEFIRRLLGPNGNCILEMQRSLFGDPNHIFQIATYQTASETVRFSTMLDPSWPIVNEVEDPEDPGTLTVTIDSVPDAPRPQFLNLSSMSDVNIPPWTLPNSVPWDPSVVPTPSADGSVPTDTTILAPILPIDTPDVPEWVTPVLHSPDDPIITAPIIPKWTEPVWPPYFDETEPVYTLLPPNINIDGGNMNYTSAITTELANVIYNGLLYGGTGLHPDVETAIFQRETERDLLVHNDQMTRLAADWAKGGFNLPTSMLNSMFMEADNNYTNKRLDISRDIAIKQAEMAQVNTHFFITNAQTMEQRMINWFGEIAKRAYDVSRSMVEFSLERYKLEISGFNTLVDLYKTKAQVYEIVTAAILKRLEGYRFQLEAAKLTGEINKINVDVYKAQLDGLMIYINKYRAEMDGAKVNMEIEQLKIQEYKARIDAYHVKVQAAVAGYGMWTTKVDAEAKEISAYSAGADAWAKRVQGIKIGIDAEAAQINAEADTNKSYATVYDADTKAYDSHTKAHIEEAIAKTKIYQSQMEGYATSVRAMEIVKNTQLKIIEGKLKAAEEEFKQHLEIAKMDFQEKLEEWRLLPETWDNLTKIWGQVVAAALNAESLTTHVSQGLSYSIGESKSDSNSCTENHNYDETTI